MPAATDRKSVKSGAAKRRKRHEREEASAEASLDDRQRKKYQRLEADERRAYRKHGAPPPDVVARTQWANGLAALVGYWSAIWEGTPAIKASRRTMLEVVRTVGMTSVKALYEERLGKLEAHIYRRRKDEGDGADELDEYRPADEGP